MTKKFSMTEQIRLVNLELFEAAVAHRQHPIAGQLALENLQLLRAGAEFEHHVHTWTDEHALRTYTRFAAALSAMLADPGFHLSHTGLAMLGTEHEALNAVFEASAFDHSDHLLSSLAVNGGEVRDFARLRFPDDNGQALAKFLTAYCLNSPTGVNFEALYRAAAQTSLPAYLGMLSHRVVLDPRAHARREELIGLHAMFRDVRMPDGLMNALSDAYMYCSYATRPDKHEAKGTFARLLRGMALQHASEPSARELRERRASLARRFEEGRKPVMLVPIEWFNSYHAMYRCYAPSVLQLREHFRLVASCKESMLDDEAKKLFDDFLWLPEDQIVLSDLVRRINALEPDVIYYPSIGMALWWVALAQLRLAPVQVMTLGHPATSASEAIDYVIAEVGQIPRADRLFVERVAYLPKNAIRFVERPDQREAREAALALPVASGSTLHVAVPSYVVKLTVPFMELLRRIRERVEQQLGAGSIRFHFFTNTIGVVRHAAKRQIDRWLPGAATVHGRDTYKGYMCKLRGCHLHLSTFPFGGTNSLVDSFALGIPVVALWGNEPHERFDGLMLERVGLEPLLAHSVEEYQRIALDLLLNPVELGRARDTLLERDVAAEFTGPGPESVQGAFGRQILRLVRDHDELSAAADRAIGPA